MKRNDCRTNELLAQVIERFMFHSEKAKSGNPFVSEMAQMMCDVEIWEMWVLIYG